MRVEFHPAAAEELAQAAAYYASQAAGLGDRFMEAVRQTIEAVVELPHRGREVVVGIRKLKVPHFPYGLIYQVTSSRITVLAVAHLMREPEYWLTRAP